MAARKKADESNKPRGADRQTPGAGGDAEPKKDVIVKKVNRMAPQKAAATTPRPRKDAQEPPVKPATPAHPPTAESQKAGEAPAKKKAAARGEKAATPKIPKPAKPAAEAKPPKAAPVKKAPAPKAEGARAAARRKPAVPAPSPASPAVPPAATARVTSIHEPQPGLALVEGATALMEQPRLELPLLDETKLVLMVRDPQWLYAYWSIAPAERESHRIGHPHGAPPLILRVFDLGQGPEPVNLDRYFDVTVVTDVSGWYVNVPHSGGHWRAALGYLDQMANFVTLCESNIVSAPSEGEVAWEEEAAGEEFWGPAEQELGAPATFHQAQLGGPRTRRRPEEARPTGPGASELALRPGASERAALRPGASELVPPRPGASEQVPRPGASERRAAEIEVQKGFWLQVYTELILYGATEPTAKVTVQGNPVRLRPDGTFTLRFALPEGEQVIPVRAVSEDESDERTITPVVIRLTR